ncbi:cytochrome c oxidase subunit VA-domain-containing protein [Lipomyces oligophaga]|uniref:cytochrome c oxidase subunit VA-domain-containing protein n=1 Tax=Lipomyces oligophaga TaxID=45792 RepID=UPI0034CFEAD2
MASLIRSSALSLLRRQAVSVARPVTLRLVAPAAAGPRRAAVRFYSAHDEETFDEFNARFEKEFDGAYDAFEVQRILTNCFSYDHVPSPTVIIKALEAARRVNDLATAVRVFEAIKLKVPSDGLYAAYLEELESVRKSLGVPLKEELFPESK